MARPGLDKDVKFRRLVKLLREPRAHVRGYLECLWDVAYEHGRERIGDAEAVGIACDYPGNPKRLVKALMSCGGEGRTGFIEPVPGRKDEYQIHDLYDHAPDYVRKRMDREAERKARGKTISGLRAEAGAKGARVTNYERKNETGIPEEKSGKCPPLAASQSANGATPAPAPAPAPAQAHTRTETRARARGSSEAEMPPPGIGAGFKEFWDSYPNHENQLRARTAWELLNPQADLRAVILAAVARQKDTDRWRRRIIPQAHNWLTDRRWEDELPDETAQPPPAQNRRRTAVDAMREELERQDDDQG